MGGLQRRSPHQEDALPSCTMFMMSMTFGVLKTASLVK